ncbi:MAG: GntR family transcriptional regulator [Vampirovibrionales bacterium]
MVSSKQDIQAKQATIPTTPAETHSFGTKTVRSNKQTQALTLPATSNVSDASYRHTHHPVSFSNGLVRLSVKNLPKEHPDFYTGETKDVIIARWLGEWIEAGLQQGTFTEQHLMPLKQDIAAVLEVSVGTVQNAFRIMEDEGLVESKQRIGTLLRKQTDADSRVRKQTSKRDTTVLAIQHYILTQGFEVGASLPSAKEVGSLIGAKVNTTRLAMEYLTNHGVIENRGLKGKQPNWILLQKPDAQQLQQQGFQGISTTTLIDQLERDLKALIAKQFEVNDRLPSHLELADQFNVSIKTVHDAVHRLVEQGLVHSKRGRYGTYVSRIPSNLIDTSLIEQLFVPAASFSPQPAEAPLAVPALATTAEAAPPFYGYEKVMNYVQTQLQQGVYGQGQKLPKQSELAVQCQVSLNSVRDGLKRLEEQGVLRIEQGRHGGAVIL